LADIRNTEEKRESPFVFSCVKTDKKELLLLAFGKLGREMPL
jgi:hypothetical protein